MSVQKNRPLFFNERHLLKYSHMNPLGHYEFIFALKSNYRNKFKNIALINHVLGLLGISYLPKSL